MNENAAPIKRSFGAFIFLTPDEPRLRAGWRLLAQTFAMFVLAIPLSPLVLLAFLLTGTIWELAIGQISELILVTVTVFLARRFLDRRSIASLGLRWDISAAKDVLAGIGITFLMMALIFGIMSSAGWLTFNGFAWQTEPLPQVLGRVTLFLAIFVLVGWNEELLSRGYHLQTIASGTNIFWGVTLSSAVFGVLHIGNPGATWVSTLGIFLAGLFLAYGYLRTGQLWLSVGLHIGWNFFEGVGFGFPVSGLDVYPLARILVHGPALWTGGAFGPEAGLVILPALFIGTGLVFLYTRKHFPKKSEQFGAKF